jgi:hypothetical protein
MPRQIAIRLGTEGKAQVVADLDAIGTTGDAAFNRLAKSAVKAGRDADAAMEFANKQASKLAALLPGLNPRKLDMAAGVRDDIGKSAESSAAVFEAAYAKMEARAVALRAAIDPAYGAQQRFDREMAEARTLISAGAISLDDYVAKLRQEQAALDAVSVGHGRAGNSAGAQRAAMQGLSYQLQDTFTQISMGTNVLQVFAIQGGQVAGQFSNLEGKAGNFARFMIGPWGLALTAAMLVLGPLVGKLFDFSNAIDDGVEKLKKDAKETENTRIAKERFARSAEGVAAAIREQADELGKSAIQERSAAERANILAKVNLQRVMSIRAVTAALLEQAIAQESVDRQRSQGPGQRGELGTLALTESSGRVAGLQAQLQANQKAIDQAARNLNLTRVDLATESAARSNDASARINRQYKDQADAARAAATARIKAGNDVGVALTRELAQIDKNRLAALKAEDDKQKALHQTAKTDRETVTAAQVARLLRSELPGVQVTSTTGGQHVKNSYHYRNQAVDFVPKGGMSAMSKDDVRKIFTSRGIDVVELLGPGDKGHSDHFHVAWTKGKLALDDFNDAAKRTKDAQRDLVKADRELDSDLADVVSRFDPARAAAEEYQATLAKIAALVSGGKLNPADAGDFRLAAMHERETKQAEAQLAKFKVLFGNEDPLADVMGGYQIERDAQLEARSEDYDRRKDGIRDLANFYRDSMSGGTRSIMDTFKQRGLDAIASMLANWTFGQSGTGGSGILSTIGSAIGSIFGGPSGSTPKLASGTEYWSGGTALLGEHGPEKAWLPAGTRVTSAGATARDAGRSAQPSVIRATFEQNFKFEGVALTQQEFVAGLNATQQSTMQRIADMNRRRA